MPLWGKTDATISRPNWINLSNYPAGTQLLFVDQTEAGLETNQSKGIKGPGWYLYREYDDSTGVKRYKTELVVAMRVPVADSGDAADDAFVPDVEVTVAISVQPANQTTVSGAATFGVTAALTPSGTVTYQWQYQAVDTTTGVNVVGATASTLVLADQTEDNDGDKYRVVVGGTGAKAVRSSSATLTFGD